MSSKYNDDDDDDIKILLEYTTEHGNDIFHYDYAPETRAEPIPEPKPDTPKDDD